MDSMHGKYFSHNFYLSSNIKQVDLSQATMNLRISSILTKIENELIRFSYFRGYQWHACCAVFAFYQTAIVIRGKTFIPNVTAKT
jgi:hypothetical protein